LQSASDIFLGWMTSQKTGRHFYVRQLRDAKIKPMVEIMNPPAMVDYAEACGWALARAHKRSGDAVVLTGYMGSTDAFETGMAGFATAYADQNERDHAALVAAVRSGRVEARVDV
jgi:predicted alpha/beta hydrolase